MGTGLQLKPTWAITPERIAKIREYSQELMSKREIAACLGIHEVTLISKLKESASFLKAYEEGRQIGLDAEVKAIRAVKASLYANALPHEVIAKDGETVIEVPGDVKAQTFILKARREGWTDQKLEISGNPDKPILFAPLFKENYAKDVNLFLEESDVDA